MNISSSKKLRLRWASMASLLLALAPGNTFAQETPPVVEPQKAPQSSAKTESPAEKAPEAKAPEANGESKTEAPTEPGDSQESEAPTKESEPDAGSAAAVTTAPAAAAAVAPAVAPAEPAGTPQEVPPPTYGLAAGAQSASANQKTEIPPEEGEEPPPEEPRNKNLMLGIAMDLTMPMGDTAKYIGDISIQGFSLDLRYYAWGNFGVGAGVSFDTLSKKSANSTQWNESLITGTQVREMSFVPVTLKGYHAWREQEKFIPYVAMGVGAARSVRRLVAGFSNLSSDSWHLILVPEVGLHIPVGPTVLMTSARLSYLAPSGDTKQQMFANLSFGLAVQ